MTLATKPFETSYKKWRHLKQGFVVKILGVQHYPGKHGLYSTVTVLGDVGDPKREKVWSAEIFRKHFEPVGRKQKTKTALDRVLEDDED